jgi:hypothetical protein
MPFNEPANISAHGMTAPLYPAVVDVMRYLDLYDGIRLFELHIFQVLFDIIAQRLCGIYAEIALERKQIITAALNYIVTMAPFRAARAKSSGTAVIVATRQLRR